jgi:hypothetical protein
MTVLRLYESIKLDVEFNQNSITDEYNGKPLDEINEDFEKFINN